MNDKSMRYSGYIFLQYVLSFFVNLLLSIPKFFSMPYTRNRTMNLLLYILLYELKGFCHPKCLILIEIFHSKHMTLKATLVSLMKPQLTIIPCHITLFLPISQTDTDHSTYLIFFIISLQSTTSTFLSLMENPRTLQLKNMYNPLSTSLNFLK